MKQLILVFLVGLTLFSADLQSQNSEYPNAIQARVNFSDFGIPQGEDFRLGEGFEVGYFRNIASFMNIGFPVRVGLAKLPGVDENTVTASLDAVLQLENTNSTGKVIPYAFAGAGIFAEAFDSSHLQIPLGAGLKIRVSDYAFVNLQGEFRLATNENRNHVQLGLGFVYLMHKVDPPVEVPDEPDTPADADGDGVPDVLDKCPEQPGTSAALGCPDRDGDGVGDDEDKCPDEAGVIETSGCPDRDNDGFADADDECPDDAGTVRGCPDSDFDGFPDSEDECPEKPGRWKGCPDTDFDGVADKDDECPNNPGPVENNGCPEAKQPEPADADRDGVLDENDDCPNTAGTLRGCPDRDNDGVADKDDQCPDEPGNVNGCPDSDDDGVLDKNDPCPTQAGTLNGCPDSDGDGVADKDDKCPNEKGIAANAGCPDDAPPPPMPVDTDRDGDGVADKDDPCPDAAGPFAGCPDTDGDGVADNLDKCPRTVGSTNNFGCPEIRQETKDQLTLAMDAVQFNSGKATLKASSFDILDGVVEILRQYPDYKLSISGHTDDVGDEDENLELSRERAKACYDYLIFRGIKAERLRYAGFGEARPIASNDTNAGREKNRRVEFELTLD